MMIADDTPPDPPTILTACSLSRWLSISARTADRWFSRHGLRAALARGRAAGEPDTDAFIAWARRHRSLFEHGCQPPHLRLRVADLLDPLDPLDPVAFGTPAPNIEHPTSNIEHRSDPAPDTPNPKPGGGWTLTDDELDVLRRLAELDVLAPVRESRDHPPIEGGPARFDGDFVDVPGGVVLALVQLGHVVLDGCAVEGWTYVLTDHGCDRVLSLIRQEAA